MATIAKDKVVGKRLSRDASNSWVETPISDLHAELQIPATSPRIFCVPPNEDPKPYEILARNDDCRARLTNNYQFPSWLFKKTWYEGNGFAGLRRYENIGQHSATITVSWIRVLVKIVNRRITVSEKDYYWHEMTFLIHDSDKGAPTVICCDIDERFHTGMLLELNTNFKNGFNWEEIHSILFRQITCEIDHSIWACSKAVRDLEKTRPDSNTSLQSNIEFPKYHDLLRHALHTSETLQATCLNLKDWLQTYASITDVKSQKTQPDECHFDMLNSFQLIQSLSKRADSNEARLRNEIGLAFNTVSQQDAKAVRIISVVTLLFLPSTFVSTLFSMSFFSFQPGYQNKWGVSQKIWIYFAVAVPLTMVTVILWFKVSAILTWLHGIHWSGESRTAVCLGNKKKMVGLFGLRGLTM